MLESGPDRKFCCLRKAESRNSVGGEAGALRLKAPMRRRNLTTQPRIYVWCLTAPSRTCRAYQLQKDGLGLRDKR